MAAPFFPAFLVGEPRATALLAPHYRDPAVRVERSREMAGRRMPAALIEVIAAQQEGLPPSASRRAAVKVLAAGAAVVVTGQQTGLFGGPLFTVYKAVTAIAAARALSVEAGVKVVPLFWLQSEDHDLAEIDHAHLPPRPGEAAPMTLRLAGAGGGERASVAHRLLGDDVLGLLDRVEAALAGLSHSTEVIAALRDAYRPGHSLPSSFAHYLASVFEEDGLLFLDPRDARIAAFSAPTVYRAIHEHEAFSSLLAERARAIEEAGFDVQVPLRGDALLAFHHPEGPTGPRFRPAATADRAALLAALEADPLRFSTSALLRPLVQDALLPAAMYVGGPGEVAYFAQLPPLYSHLGLPPPIVLPRARVRIVDAASAGQGASLPPGLPSPEVLAAALTGAADADLGALADAADSLDPELRRAVRRTRETIARAASRLTARYSRALLARSPRPSLDPPGAPQERFYGLPYFAARWGLPLLKQRLLQSIDPFAAGRYEIAL